VEGRTQFRDPMGDRSNNKGKAKIDDGGSKAERKAFGAALQRAEDPCLWWPHTQDPPFEVAGPKGTINAKKITNQWVYVIDNPGLVKIGPGVFIEKAGDPGPERRTWRTIRRTTMRWARPGEAVVVDGDVRVVLAVGSVTYAIGGATGGADRMNIRATIGKPDKIDVSFHDVKRGWQKIPIVNLVGELVKDLLNLVFDVLSDPEGLVTTACVGVGAYYGGATGAAAGGSLCAGLFDSETADSVAGVAGAAASAEEGDVEETLEKGGEALGEDTSGGVLIDASEFF
ncbi:MAG: hypothetical protein ACOCUS_00740, partial [Polyangiales bacterium]